MTRPGETGSILKSVHGLLSVALVYPNTYRVGMGNLGFQWVYGCLNRHPRIVAERFFFPEPDKRSDRGTPAPVSEETGRPLREFPVIAFSVPFENDYPAVPATLKAAGIPPLQKDRRGNDPLVVAGGVSPSLNPEPLAAFFDLVYIGELDQCSDQTDLWGALAEFLLDAPLKAFDRDEFLSLFRSVPGVYVPSGYSFSYHKDGSVEAVDPRPGFPERIRAVKRRTGSGPVRTSVFFSPEGEFGEALLLELNRGCARGCRFCSAGWMHRPVRHARFHDVRPAVEEAIRSGRTVGLIGSDLAGNPELEDLLQYTVDQGGRFSLSSIRPEGLSPEVIRLVAMTGQKTATLAPEAPSSRLKRVIGKPIPNQRFLELVEALVSGGIPNIRFYFMVGLPTETDDDVEELVSFVEESQAAFVKASRPRGRIGTIAVQVNPFVPKPWTPFQWVGMASKADMRRRVRVIQQRLRKVPNVIVRVEPMNEAVAQAIFSRADRRVADVILDAAADMNRWTSLVSGNRHAGELYAFRTREGNEVFPWDVVDHGISKDFLWKSYQEALDDSEDGTEPCDTP